MTHVQIIIEHLKFQIITLEIEIFIMSVICLSDNAMLGTHCSSISPSFTPTLLQPADLAGTRGGDVHVQLQVHIKINMSMSESGWECSTSSPLAVRPKLDLRFVFGAHLLILTLKGRMLILWKLLTILRIPKDTRVILNCNISC